MDPKTWDWWRAALKGNFAPITEEPCTGYYRLGIGRGGELLPIIYWWQDGKLRCLHGAREIDEDIARERWPFASKRPISREAYDFWKANGRWPDESEAANADRKNSPVAPDAGSLEAFADRVDDLAREAEQIVAGGAAQNQEAADRAADLAQRLTKLETDADKARETEKKPHLEAGRAVDAKWMPLRDRAADLKRRLKRLVLDPFLAKKNAELQAQRAAAAAKGQPDAVPQRVASAGTMGRKVTQRTIKRGEITDAKALACHLIDNDHPDMKSFLQRFADAAASRGITAPGMKIIEEKVAA